MDSRDPTPEMEEEDLQFNPLPPREYPISPIVVIQDHPPVVLPPPSVVRLPSPYPVFNASWPIPAAPQGPRAFIRSSMVFQPSTRQFRPISTITTSLEPSDGHVSDVRTEESVIEPQNVRTEESPHRQVQSRVNNTNSPPQGQLIPTILSSHRTSDPIVTDASNNIHAHIPTFSYSSQSQAFQGPPPDFPEVVQPPSQREEELRLRKKLEKLQEENSRLRNENRENICHLQSITDEMQQAMRARMDSMDTEFRRRLAELSTERQRSPSRQRTRDRSPEASTSGNAPTFTRPQRVFGKEEKLTGNKNFREWASAIITEFLVLGILETVMAEFAANLAV